MDAFVPYSADRSLKGKLRRPMLRLVARRPARRRLERPMVTFTFDDAPATAFDAGGRTLEARGVRGAYYVSTDLAGQTGPAGRYGNREEILAAAAAGHEIACHTAAHLDCGAADYAAIQADVARNAAVFAAWGLPPARQFAYPYGDVSLAAKRVLQGRFDMLRALHRGLIVNGADLNQAPSVGIEGPDGEALARRWLTRAAQRRAWLVLYTHDVCDTPSPWGCTQPTLERLIDTALALDIDIVTLSEGLSRLGG